jgi:hypothetical protein
MNSFSQKNVFEFPENLGPTLLTETHLTEYDWPETSIGRHHDWPNGTIG